MVEKIDSYEYDVHTDIQITRKYRVIICEMSCIEDRERKDNTSARGIHEKLSCNNLSFFFFRNGCFIY